MVDPDSIATIHLNALCLTKQADGVQRTLTATIPSSSGKIDAELQNACQEMENKPQNNRTLTVNSSHNKNRLFFSFTDTGRGISKENLIKIFSFCLL